jgi:hypothetical protein
MDAFIAIAERWADLLSDPSSLIDTSRRPTEVLKTLFLTIGIAMALIWPRLPKRRAQTALLILTLLATVNYGRWGPKVWVEQIDTYDVMHYYINAKYFDELGYYDLYPAILFADHENDGPFFKQGDKYMAQDERGHSFKSIRHAINQGRKVSERFSPDDWLAFEHDVLYIQRHIYGFNDKLWRQMILDHGFNGTPPWTVVAAPFAKIVPVHMVKLLGWLDMVLLIGTLIMVGWAYGRSTALWVWLFLVTTYSTRWPMFSWSFLRYDYLCMLLIAMSFLRKGRPFLAGLATGWASAVRLFPLMWLFGPGAKAFFGLLRTRRLSRNFVLLGLGTVLSLGALNAAAAAYMGPSTIVTHFENMLDHNKSEQLSSRRIGMALALPYRGELKPKFIEPARKKKVEAQKPLRFAIAGVVMLLLGWGLRRARDDEAYAYGFVPFFLLTTASYYYYVVRAPLILLHASDLSKRRNRYGLAFLLGLEWFTNWAEVTHSGHRVYLIGTLAWGLGIYVAVMTVWTIIESHRDGEVTGYNQGS